MSPISNKVYLVATSALYEYIIAEVLLKLSKRWNLYFILPLHELFVCVSLKVLLRKFYLFKFMTISSIKSEYFFSSGSNWRFFFYLPLEFYFRTHFWKKKTAILSILPLVGFRHVWPRKKYLQNKLCFK